MENNAKEIVTVADLIEALQAFPATARVTTYTGWCTRSIESVSFAKAGGPGVGLHDTVRIEICE